MSDKKTAYQAAEENAGVAAGAVARVATIGIAGTVGTGVGVLKGLGREIGRVCRPLAPRFQGLLDGVRNAAQELTEE